MSRPSSSSSGPRPPLLTRPVRRNDLKSVLSKSSSSLNVGLLLESIAQTDDFEREMARKYSMPFEDVLQLSQITYGVNDPSALITSVFEPYLGVFVDAQDKCACCPLLTPLWSSSDRADLASSQDAVRDDAVLHLVAHLHLTF